MSLTPAPLLVDVFCRVIDNFGDIGVCWRLSADLASRGHSVRLWVDDASALEWMAPRGCPGVEVLVWDAQIGERCRSLPRADVWIEAFGCEIAPEFIANYVRGTPATGLYNQASGLEGLVWLNLEYLSAEAYVARSHGLPSPVLSGPAAGLATKWFFFPGFTPDTGGLIREPDALARDAVSGVPAELPLTVKLFCYEPPALAQALRAWANGPEPVTVLAPAGRSWDALQDGVQDAAKRAAKPSAETPSQLALHRVEPTDQAGFDAFLRSGSDLNCVRGEDSLVRAIWAGEALLWNIYPQDDGAHAPKLEAFLDWLEAPDSMRHAHRVWNGLLPADRWVAPSRSDLADWRRAVRNGRERLLAQSDLTTRLLEFIAQKQSA
jgi:uncharacterized repeat protein (TIGR03837 family)